MAGVLAPEIGDIGAPGPVRVPQGDTSIGNFLGDMSSIFDAALKDSGGEGGNKPTQTDRDREGLSGVAEQVARITQQRNSGDLSPEEATVRLRKLRMGAEVAFPDKTGDLNNIFGTITGEENSAVLEDPFVTYANARVGAASKGDDPILQDMLASSITYDNFGQVDPAATRSKFLAKDAQRTAFLAQNQVTKENTERLKSQGAFDDAAQEQAVEPFMVAALQASQDVLSPILETFKQGAQGPIDVANVTIAIEQKIGQLKNEFTQRAAQAGILDNFEAKFSGGMDKALAPLINFKNFLASIGTERASAINNLDTEQRIAIAGVFEANGIPFVTNPESLAFFSQTIVGENLKGIRQSVEDIKEKGNVTRPRYVFDAVTQSGGTVHDTETGGVTAQAKESMKALPPEKAKSEVKRGLAAFQGWSSIGSPTPEHTTFAVDGFVEAAEVMNQRGVPVAEDTFDTVYNADFWRDYNLIQALGTENATRMEQAAATSLRTILSNKEVETTHFITTSYGTTLPNLTVEFDGTKWGVVLSAATNNEKAITKALDANGLPHTGEGLLELDRILKNPANTQITNNKFGEGPQVTSLTGFKLSIDDSQFRRVIDSVAYMNKIVANVNKLPQEVRDANLPTPKDRVIRVSSEEEFKRLKKGDRYVVDMPGFTHAGVR